MHLAEIIVGLMLVGLFFRSDILKRAPVKFGFVVVTAYLASENLALGCLAAIVLLRALHETPTQSWRPPRTDRLGLDTLMRTQESFFRPVLRTHGEPVSEPFQAFTSF